MFIKRVTINGFRSYADEVIVEPFSPCTNIIIGKNGSGKSNLFFAIQFVLSKEYTTLSDEQRISMISDLVKHKHASVEVTFDNSDGKFQQTSDSVNLSICRMIGSKKDQFYLNQKLISKTELYNLLECAGFSPNNPYNIVKQGKVTQLAMCGESQRLDTFLEVAGIKVYEQRRLEIDSDMNSTINNLNAIKQDLSSLEDLIGDAEKDSKKFERFKELESAKNELEYAIHKSELKDIENQIKPIQQSLDDLYKQGSNKVDSIKHQCESISSQMTEINSTSVLLNHTKSLINDEIITLSKQKMEIDLKLSQLDTSEGIEKLQNRENMDSSERIEEIRKKTSKEINEKQQKLEGVIKELSYLNSKLEHLNSQRDKNYTLKGENREFLSKKDLKLAIKNYLDETKKTIEEKKLKIKKMEDSQNKENSKNNSSEREINDLLNILQNEKKELGKIENNISNSKNEKLKIIEKQM
ncbi:MAG: Structural maintenance of chromosomes protein 3 [Paramarteilia canceri]